MARALPFVTAIGLASCFAFGCNPASTEATKSTQSAGSAAAGSKTVTLYIPEMCDKLELL